VPGISSATLGISSSFDNPFRMWKCEWTKSSRGATKAHYVRLGSAPHLDSTNLLNFSVVLASTFCPTIVWKHRDLYGPLNDDVTWHLDFTMHLYSFALFPIFAIPLAISSSLNPPMQ